MQTIEDTKKAIKLLTLADLRLPSPPRIERIDVKPYTDWTGEDALEVWLILSESTKAKDLNADAIWAIDEKIHDRLLAEGIHLFPLTRYAKQSELDELAEEGE